jgi:arsenate reductase-like glutaredoxin family protein
MKKMYHLKTCSTCARIINGLALPSDFKLQDIKSDPITEEQLEQLREMAGTYEALFSKKAIKYREWKLREKKLTEKDFRSYILKEYTFLKRPVIVIDQDIFIGNSKDVIKAANSTLHA